jgi:hypothetical protein
MLDFISAMGGGEGLVHAVLGALGAGTGTVLVRPKVHLGLMAGITAFFPDSRIHRAFLEAFTVANGGELPPKANPPKKDRKGKKKRGK